jgi:tripartite-type tricarboxylate transporter receptor subunit TctC
MKHLKKLLVAVVIALLTPVSFAQMALPTKQLTIITSFPVGSGPDSLIRKILPELSKQFQVPVIIENKPGANGSVAYDACNKAVNTSQNYYICYSEAGTVWAYPFIYGNDNLIKHLKPVVPSHRADLVLVTSPNIKNVEELKVAFKKSPNFGSWTIGSQGQVLSLQVAEFLKVPAEHVPYKDYAQWLIDVSTERLAFSFATLGSSQPLMLQGKLKYLAIGTPKRDPHYPDVPTVNELFGPKMKFQPMSAFATFYVKDDIGILDETIIRNGFRAVLNSPEYKADLYARGYRPWAYSEKETNEAIQQTHDNYVKMINTYKIEMKQN